MGFLLSRAQKQPVPLERYRRLKGDLSPEMLGHALGASE